MSRSKNHINIAVIGSQGSGKSTLCGHLLFQCGTFGSHSVESSRDEIRLAKNSSSMNEFSLLVSSSQSKHQHGGMTVDNGIHRLETPQSICTLVDTPGNEKQRKSLCAALGQADVAILVVDSMTDVEFSEVSDARFGYPEMAEIAHDQGVRHMVVAVTKVDGHVSEFSKKEYDNIVKKIGFSLDKIGFESSTIPFIPLSGLKGDNLTYRSPSISWYDGAYLVEALDQVETPVRESAKQLWIPILSVCHVERIGTVAIGTIEAGTLTVGMQVKILPNDITAKVESIEMHHSALSTAQAGDHVGFNLVTMNGEPPVDIRSGCIAADHDVSYSTLVDHGYL